MFKILTLNNISKSGTDLLPTSAYSVIDKCDSPDGVMLRSYNMHEMDIPKSVIAVARAGAGTNNIPIDKCTDAGIVVFNTPGANANAVKELAVAALLMSSRKISEGIIWAQGLKGREGVAKLVEKGKAEFTGPEIMGKTLGVIGLGAIGVLVANACRGLGMEVIGYDPFLSVEAAWSLSRTVKKAESLADIYANSDYISIHVPLNADTKAMFNAEVFAQMKDGARLINFSRGELVDDKSVTDALAAGKLSCYVTDFPNENLLGVKGVVPIPHLGASTPESEDNCAAMAAMQIKDYLEYGNIRNSVNYPECFLPYTNKKRFCVTHKNSPGIIGPITTAVAKANLNIDNMINKSRDKVAYTMIDVDQKDVGDAKDVISAVEGVISVRVI